MLLDDERCADEYTRCNGQDETNNLVRCWATCCVTAHAPRAGVELVGGKEEMRRGVHGEGCRCGQRRAHQ